MVMKRFVFSILLLFASFVIFVAVSLMMRNFLQSWRRFEKRFELNGMCYLSH